MSKTTPTPKEFQIAGTEDLGCEIVMTRNVPATLSHVEHTVRALSGRDEMALKQMGYQFHHSFGIASKVFKAGSSLFAAALAGSEENFDIPEAFEDFNDCCGACHEYPCVCDLIRDRDVEVDAQMSFPRADFQILLRRDDHCNAPTFAMPGDAYSEVR